MPVALNINHSFLVRMNMWRLKATCKDMDPNIFFPPEKDEQAIKIAKTICASCLVQQECLEEGLKPVNRDSGVWGGLWWKERKALIRKNRSKKRTQRYIISGLGTRP